MDCAIVALIFFSVNFCGLCRTVPYNRYELPYGKILCVFFARTYQGCPINLRCFFLRRVVNSLTAIRFWQVLAGSKNSCPVGFVRRNSTKSTVISNTTINKHHHHGGAVCPSYGVGSMDPPNLRRVTSSKGVGQGRFSWD